MKTIKYLLVGIVSVIFISCSGDDSPSIDQSLISGEWNLEELNYTGSTSFSQDGFTNTLNYSGEGINMAARINLHNNNYVSEGSYTVKLSVTVEGETTFENYPFNNFSSSGTYRIEGNKLITDNETVNGQQFSEINMMAIKEATIAELSTNRLVLTIEENFTYESGGVNFEIKLIGQEVFSR